jgi:nucleoside-diphosphate-sugar epimerase
MKILITGASGFIGSYLFKKFSETNHDVYGLVRKKPSLDLLKKNKDKIIISDLVNYESLNKLIPKKVDLIIHAGAYNDQDTNNNVESAYLTNIYGTRNICKIANSRNVKKLIYFSVLQVYGRELVGQISEKSEIVCDNDYSLTHFLSENICKNYSLISKTKFIVLRLGYIFGCPIEDKIDRKTLIPYFICQQAIKKGKIELKSKGRARRDFVSLRTLFISITGLLKKKSKFQIYNVTSGYSFSIKKIVKIVQEEATKLLNSLITVNYGTINDKTNFFKTLSKLKLYKNKDQLMFELREEIKKMLKLINEK